MSCSADLSRSSPLVYVHDVDVHALQSMKRFFKPNYAVKLFDQASSLLNAFSNANPPDLTVLAWSTPSQSASTLKQVVAASDGAPVLLLFGDGSSEHVASAVRLGATGYLHKPLYETAFEQAVEEQLAWIPEEASVSGKLNGQSLLNNGEVFIHSSKTMGEIVARAALIARTDIPVLILGESGTGKEVLAKYTHLTSDRSKKMFLKVNCAAMPADLLESELFGYEKGAFTGAFENKQGKFEICNGGTIFLDEIGEMSGVLQAKLLHVLQDGIYNRLGSRTMMKADVRVIAATNIDMGQALANKTFREDLYYRLNGFSMTLPPLRERRQEIALFTDHFMQKAARKCGREPIAISNTLRDALTNYSWPGNLRELENIVTRHLIIGDEKLLLSELSGRVMHSRVDDQPQDPTSEAGLREHIRRLTGNAESEAIASALKETRWNRRAAARKLDISYTALRYKIKNYDLERGNS